MEHKFGYVMTKFCFKNQCFFMISLILRLKLKELRESSANMCVYFHILSHKTYDLFVHVHSDQPCVLTISIKMLLLQLKKILSFRILKSKQGVLVLIAFSVFLDCYKPKTECLKGRYVSESSKSSVYEKD